MTRQERLTAAREQISAQLDTADREVAWRRAFDIPIEHLPELDIAYRPQQDGPRR